MHAYFERLNKLAILLYLILLVFLIKFSRKIQFDFLTKNLELYFHYVGIKLTMWYSRVNMMFK